MQGKEGLIAGNSVIGAGMVAYSGPFTSSFRHILETNWIKKLDEVGILHEEDISMNTVNEKEYRGIRSP